MTVWRRAFLLALLIMASSSTLAEQARFDLIGPRLDVKVTHAGATLPIAEVPNLSVGDQVSIKAALPARQSARYLLVAAFLRGATNPPPKAWFHAARTWDREGARGLKLTVPEGARQVLVFLAPATGGDFNTLVDAVRGRPGAFVRASQDLGQASLDRSRLDAYLAAVRGIDATDPGDLKAASPILARSLLIKLDANCLRKVPELQAACLTQGADQLVLNDGRGTSVVQDVTSGSPADLIQQIGAGAPGGTAYFSPYLASIMDIARILDSLHTAHYQYIPALAVAKGETLSLLLNTAPSFHNPMSVLVVALPAVESSSPPALQPVDPGQVYCLQAPDLVLATDGAPLAYSTSYARDLTLHLEGMPGGAVDLPLRIDARKGGLEVVGAGRDQLDLHGVVEGAVRGRWGFMPYDGPKFRLQSARGGHWRLAPGQPPLIVGGAGEMLVQGGASHCVSGVSAISPPDQIKPATWVATAPDKLVVTAPLQGARPGELTLSVRQYGEPAPARVSVRLFAPASRLDGFLFHAGDASGVLKGDHLGDVASLTLGQVVFKPAPGAIAVSDELTMAAAEAAAKTLTAGETVVAKVTLTDGRVLDLATTVASARPQAVLVDKSLQSARAVGPAPIDLLDPDEAPENAVLSFSIRALPPTTLSKSDQVEVATADGAFSTTLTSAKGLVLEDSHVAVTTIDPGAAFGPSGYGALRFRLVQNGVASDWRHLATLVRLPQLRGVTCKAGVRGECLLHGSDLYLIAALSSDAGFEHAVVVPEGFTGGSLLVPHPTDGKLYLKLHDDPAVVNLAAFPDAQHRGPHAHSRAPRGTVAGTESPRGSR